MLIVNNEPILEYHSIIKYIPERLRKYTTGINQYKIEEIRLRKGAGLMVTSKNSGFFIDKKGLLTKNSEKALRVTDEDIKQALNLICNSSLYTIEDSLKDGYITLSGGHRVGICGSVVVKDEHISSIKNISSLNYRIARQVIGVSQNVIERIIYNNKVLNTLIISPPGCGKTTMLRDIIRNLSYLGYRVCVADERNEITALDNGYLGYDLGNSCDVLEGGTKSETIFMLLRTMSPQVLATDEVGGDKDILAIKKAMYCGVSVIATIHADDRESLKYYNSDLLEKFDCFITLSHRNGVGTIEEIYCDI